MCGASSARGTTACAGAASRRASSSRGRTPRPRDGTAAGGDDDGDRLRRGREAARPAADPAQIGRPASADRGALLLADGRVRHLGPHARRRRDRSARHAPRSLVRPLRVRRRRPAQRAPGSSLRWRGRDSPGAAGRRSDADLRPPRRTQRADARDARRASSTVSTKPNATPWCGRSCCARPGRASARRGLRRVSPFDRGRRPG